MNSATQNLHSRMSNDTLHIAMSGIFDENSARELLSLLPLHSTGRIFIDTKNVEAIAPQARILLHGALLPLPAMRKRLFFKGEKGFELAPNGSKVLVVPKKEDAKPQAKPKQHHCHCTGKCAQCKCKTQQ